MSAALVADLCGACQEADCECCDYLVLRHPCGCGCTWLQDILPPVIVVRNRMPLPTTPRTRTHCPQGHPLIGENIYQEIRHGQRGRRLCRTCRRASWRKARPRQQRRKEAS